MSTPTKILRAIVDHYDGGCARPSADGPGHCHEVRGQWESGESCTWCATWTEARRIVEVSAVSSPRPAAQLADLLMEADARLRVEIFEKGKNEPPPGWIGRMDSAEKDAAAIRRVIEILKRTGGAGRDAREREGTPATPEEGANPSPSTKQTYQTQSLAEAEEGGS